MILDLRKIKRSGKDTQDFFFLYSPEDFSVDIPNTTLKLPVEVSGSVTITDNHSAYLDGEIKFSLVGECSRCLDSVEQSFITEFSEDAGTGEGSYPVINDTINLVRLVEDCILSEIPINLLCKEDCKGLCSYCGANLNDGECKCKK